jgi:SNF2 family DNA or RNA helicase
MVVETPIREIELRDYQQVGVDFMRENKRVMLLDKAGLGKTPQATFAAEEPVLVVCPNYLVDQWVEWLVSIGKDAVAAKGNRFERMKILESGKPWIVANVEMLGSLSEWFSDKKNYWWRTIIIDESHHLKSHKGIRAKVAVKMAKNCEYVYLLTATPIKREVDDLFMQLRILQPDIFTSYWRFVKQFCIVEDTHFGTQILGAKKSMLPDLHKLLDILSIGRDYEEVPPIIEKYIYVEMNPQVKKLYNELVNEWRIRIQEAESEGAVFTNYMEIMHNLRQHLTGNLKMDAVKNLYEDIDSYVSEHELESRFSKTVVASWYKNTCKAVANVVPDCVAIDGDIKDPGERKRMALASPNVSCTISSLGEGVDLSGSRNFVFVEEDWTPGSNYQVLSRVVRERQEENNSEPVVDYVHCKGTIDEKIHKYSKTRAATAKEVVRDALYL